MNKDDKEKSILEKIAKFAKFDNPNNFDDYYVKTISELSKNKNI